MVVRCLPVAIVVMAVVCSGGCGAKPVSEYIDQGVYADGQYRNTYFDFVADIPAEYVVASAETLKATAEAGRQLIEAADGSAATKAAVRASDVTTMQLFLASKYEIGHPVAFNPNVVCLVENLSGAPGVKKPGDYLFHAMNLLKTTGLNYSVDMEFTDLDINGRTFSVARAELDNPPLLIKQEYVVTLTQGFALAFIATYENDDDHTELMNIISSYRPAD